MRHTWIRRSMGMVKFDITNTMGFFNCEYGPKLVVTTARGHVEAHRPHPAAPQDIKDAFANLFKRFDSSSSSTSASVASSTGGASAKSESPNSKASGSRTYAEFWEAPEKLWRTVAMTEREMESVMTGGAA
ncbi:hypothetical protein PIIN_07774 [Serendipita indica DSM 11827]|uniref:Uncharacterized protein n=1 Tax=Serendipita indica (strain DSM 11827) TaxID=1109443 RepID=G4TR77_SERID|nr:hypothetical protein PIIN_07774 [Serendipita indica DSM 11827]